MKYQIVVTYKNGSIIKIDVPENYYQEKYSKKPNVRIHQIFIKEYRDFINALNKNASIVHVGKYLKFSNATISAKDILGIDLKLASDESLNTPDNNISIKIPGVYNCDRDIYSIEWDPLINTFKKIEDTNIIEKLYSLIEKFNDNSLNIIKNTNKSKNNTQNKKQNNLSSICTDDDNHIEGTNNEF